MTTAASRFRAMHAKDAFFVMPNPWDRGTAQILAGSGFAALASSSAALAWSSGRPDNSVSATEAIDHAALLADASGLPVNGDFEAGYGQTPGEVAETIRRAIDAGVAGCSIEDCDPCSGDNSLYDFEMALERFAAARRAVEESGSDFVLTGRCESFFSPMEDPLGEACRRLKAYADEGADVVYAPGLKTAEEVSAIVEATPCPVNVLGGIGGISDDLAALKQLGVTRVSIGGGLFKVAYGAFHAAVEKLAGGEIDFSSASGLPDLDTIFRP